MTDKLYLITEAQRLAQIEALNTHPDFDAENLISEAVGVLQSLPMVKGEPVAIKKHYPDMHMVSMNDGGYKCIEELKPIELETLLYTSPKALTPITADDVSDACVRELWAIGRLTNLGHLGKSDVVVYLNTFLKHRSEAR